MYRKVEASKYVDLLKRRGAKVAKAEKFARVLAREGEIGEEIVTYASTGDVDTRNRVGVEIDPVTNEQRPGMVLTMAMQNGEPVIDKFGHTNTWIVSASVFNKKYEKSEIEGVYTPKGAPQDFIQIDENVVITASWGEEQYLRAGAYLNVTEQDDVYGIAEDEFNHTYRWCD